ncbi:MAG: alanyl aminopeptidase [Phenylobacterium sp.]|jgi:alanyl aminopeptidase
MNKWQKLLAVLLCIGAGVFCFRVISNVQYERDLAEKRSSPQAQLPDTVVPLGYALTLRVDPQKAGFSGVVKIQLQIKKAVKEIWLHGQNISASHVTLHTQDDSIDLSYQEMGDSGVVHLTTKRTLLPQTAELEIHYTAAYDPHLLGLYKVEDNQLPYIFSQFEAIGARKAFPGFDEPRFKVPFDLTLEIKQGDKGFTNTPQISSENLADGYQRLTFATTKPLPTYLLAFAVGDLDVVEYQPVPASSVRATPLPLRGIAVKGKGKQLQFALQNTASILAILEDYFGTPYPYQKLDLVAVPDFAAGAMENAGIITYREQLLLLGDSPTYAEQRAFARVHTHELSHQWFGNLVTMPWWDDIWLNEAFATWITNKAVNQWKPGFEFSRNLMRRGHWVMTEDALVSARPVREKITSNDDIENAFDRITSAKGGAVLQMFERFIGEQTFRKGVQYHLKRFAFGHADADDFIESIEHVSGNSGLKAAYFSFLTQPGVPKVEVDWHCSGSGADSVVNLSLKQSRYLPLGSTGNSEQLWNLPVCLTLIDNNPLAASHRSAPVCTIITEAEQSLTVREDCPVAVMPNNEGSGYYRFSYPQSKWFGLLGQFKALSTVEKYAVANNLAAAFRDGDIDASFYINAAKPFAREEQWDLITAPMHGLAFIDDYIANPSEKEQLAVFLDELYRPLLNQLGLQARSARDKKTPVGTSLLRRQLIEFMALRVKDAQLRAQLLGLAKSYIGYLGNQQLDTSVLNPDLVYAALAVAVGELGKPYFDALKDRIHESSDAMFRQRGLEALGAAVDPELAKEVRSMVLSLSLKNNERAYLVSSQLRNVEHRPAVYQWLKSYFGVLSAVLPQSLMAISPKVASGFCSKERALDVATFFSDKIDNIAGARHHLEMTLERINICVAIKANQQGLLFAGKGGL